MAPKAPLGSAPFVVLATGMLFSIPVASLSPAEAGAVPVGLAQGEERVDFQKQIRPILADYCYECHGEDEASREAELRLDRRESAFGDLGGYRAIVPGDPDDSELYLRIASEFAEDRMPPYDAGTELTRGQIEVIRKWIEQGAEWVDN